MSGTSTCKMCVPVAIGGSSLPDQGTNHFRTRYGACVVCELVKPCLRTDSRHISGSPATPVTAMDPALTPLPFAFAACAAFPQRFYDFGVENVVRGMFMDPRFCSFRGEGRDNNPDDFYGSRYAQQINANTHGEFFEPDSSAYDLGFDFGEVFSFKKYSCGMLFIRCVLPAASACAAGSLLPLSLYLRTCAPCCVL